jgi:hypothetical protein
LGWPLTSSAMFTIPNSVYIHGKLDPGAHPMATAKNPILHKHFRLDSAKLKRAQKMLDAKTETEAVERALELAIAEHQRNRLTAEANRRFLNSGIVLRDVFGACQEK